MAINVSLKPGWRVRLAGDVVGNIVIRATACIVRPDLYDGYVVVRLDSPAIIHHADRTTADLRELVEAIDDLTILDSAH